MSDIRSIQPPTRPWWKTAMALFCLASLAFLIPRDLFLEHTRDVEVWFGFELRGSAARLTAPLHWIFFLVGAWGFWFQRAWIVPSAAVYSFYIGFSHVVWNQLSPNGLGWIAGIAEGVFFSIPGIFFVCRLAATRPRDLSRDRS